MTYSIAEILPKVLSSPLAISAQPEAQPDEENLPQTQVLRTSPSIRRQFTLYATPIEELWYRGFMELRRALSYLPGVISALCKWVPCGPDKEGFWRIVAIVATDTDKTPLAKVMMEWIHSAQPSSFLDWCCFNSVEVKTADDGTLRGQLLYRRGETQEPDWLRRLKPKEPEEDLSVSTARPRGPGE